MIVVGRNEEQKLLEQIASSKKSEFVAVYGRRRVGKTYLIHEYFSKSADFYLTVQGKKDGSTAEQLSHLQKALEEGFYRGHPIPRLASWNEALELLAKTLEEKIKQDRIELAVVFLDELPWLATPRSGMLQALDYNWNTRLSRISQLKLIVCGSAASWMIENLIHAKGGLYNRLTHVVKLLPFTLGETKELCRSRKLNYTEAQVLELYMTFGGIPYYIDQLQRGASVAQNIASLCFAEGGSLKEEWKRLFPALFNDPEQYEAIVRALFHVKQGMSLKEIAKRTGISVGGRLKLRLQELEQAGFISSFIPYGKLVKDTYYRIVDEFTLFHFHWIDKGPKGILAGKAGNFWLNKLRTPAYAAWAGNSFECVCLRHADAIARALRISSVPHTVGTWRYVPTAKEKDKRGAQIDLLFDRSDGVITLCEMKYTTTAFTIDKSYARELKQKIEVFQERTKTKKQIQLAIVTTDSLKANTWSEDLVDNVILADELF
jgi:uncharacterized protein